MHILNGAPGQAELGVGQHHYPGPVVSLLRSPYAWGGPVEGLFTKSIGVFQIEPPDVGPPEQGEIRLAGSAPPQPEAFGIRVWRGRRSTSTSTRVPRTMALGR